MKWSDERDAWAVNRGTRILYVHTPACPLRHDNEPDARTKQGRAVKAYLFAVWTDWNKALKQGKGKQFKPMPFDEWVKAKGGK